MILQDVHWKLKILIHLLSKFKKFNCEIYGISKDSIESHHKFKKKYNVKFDLLADDEKKVIKAYKVWGKKKFMGKEFMGIIRSTFLINEQKKKLLKFGKTLKLKTTLKKCWIL